MASKVRELREAAGMTQEELAQKAGASMSEIVNLEDGSKLCISSKTLVKIAEILGSTVDEMCAPNWPGRNVKKTADKMRGQFAIGSGLSYYDLSFGELQQLYDIFEAEGLFHCIVAAFHFGFVLGHRATVAGRMTGKI